MILVIFGSRSVTDMEVLHTAMSMANLNGVKKIISGGARGADALAERYAKEKGIPFECFPARWDVEGRQAGMIRNRKMANVADYGVALWDGKSKGTANMIKLMHKRVFVWRI